MRSETVAEAVWEQILGTCLPQGCGTDLPKPVSTAHDENYDESSPYDIVKERVARRFLAEGWTSCHAAAAWMEGRFVIFPGVSGSGKSTLACLLALRGYAVADDLVFLREADGGVEAVVPPLPLSALEETLRHLPETANWRLGREYPCEGKIILKPPVARDSAGTVSAVVLMRPGRRKSEVSLSSARRQEAARLLLGNVVHYAGGGSEYADARRRAWEVFCAVLDRVPTYVLRGDLLRDAAATADEIEKAVRGG